MTTSNNLLQNAHNIGTKQDGNYYLSLSEWFSLDGNAQMVAVLTASEINRVLVKMSWLLLLTWDKDTLPCLFFVLSSYLSLSSRYASECVYCDNIQFLFKHCEDENNFRRKKERERERERKKVWITCLPDFDRCDCLVRFCIFRAQFLFTSHIHKS